MSFLLLFQNVLHFEGWDYMIFMLNHVESGERCCFGWPAVSFFFSFAMSTLSMNSASLFAYVGVFVFCCGISGISTDSTLNEMAM